MGKRLFASIGLAALAVLVAAGAAVAVEVKVVREIMVGADFTPQDLARAAGEMMEELGGLGCLKSSYFAATKIGEPKKLQIVMFCREWREGSPYRDRVPKTKE